jgi:hypothetical protein
MIPITGDGYVSLPLSVLNSAMSFPFLFDDIYIYSHGWWTTPERAMDDYTTFSLGLSSVFLTFNPPPTSSAFGLGISWPAMVGNTSNAFTNFVEVATFWQRALMANKIGDVGAYTILRNLLNARQLYAATLPAAQIPPPLRIHCLGHSFGCRVLLSFLEQMQEDVPALLTPPTVGVVQIVLIQAATPQNDLDKNIARAAYPNVADIPNIRMLVTTSGQDIALGTAFPLANSALVETFFTSGGPALGSAGPPNGLFGPASPLGLATLPLPVVVGSGFDGSNTDLSGRLVVAQLDQLHTDDAASGRYTPDRFSGSHSDIFQPEIYKLVARFIAGFPAAGGARIHPNLGFV